MSTTTRVNVVQGGVRRCLFSIVDKNNSTGDLTIALRSDVPERPTGELWTPTDPSGATVEMTRISVHRTPNSTNHVNVIKVTRQFSNRPAETLVNNTTAIKKGKQFEFLLGWRCSLLWGDTWKEKRADAQIDIPNAPESFTPCLAVFVGPVDKSFRHVRHTSDDFDWRQTRFSNFSLVVVWSYLGLSSHESALLTFAGSPPGVLLPGVNESGAIRAFKVFRETWRQEFISTLTNLSKNGDGFGKTMLPIFKESRFFKHPSTTTPQYRRWLRAAAPTAMRMNLPTR